MGAFTAIQDIERLMEKYALEIQSSEGKDRKKAENNFSICLEKYDVLGGHDHIRQFELITTGLGLDEDSLNTSTEAASGGEITRASLAKAEFVLVLVYIVTVTTLASGGAYIVRWGRNIEQDKDLERHVDDKPDSKGSNV